MGGKKMEISYTQLKPVLATGPTCFILTIAEGAGLWLPQEHGGVSSSSHPLS